MPTTRTLLAVPSRRPTVLASLAALALGGCSGAGEDVRTKLCKDLVLTQVSSPSSVVWEEASNRPRGYEHLAVELRFRTGDQPGTAVCSYPYRAVDDTALTLSDPLAAYGTSPTEMRLNGRALPQATLANAIKAAMQQQGRELVEGAQKALGEMARGLQGGGGQ